VVLRELPFQRACQAYLWSLPAVSFTAWQRGITKQLGATNGQIVSILSYEARRGVLTANATTPYYLGFADLSAGPLILEMPARGVQGGTSDAWQMAIPGTKNRGKYLVLGPGQKLPGNTEGYIVRRSPTFNIFIGVRLTDPDPEKHTGWQYYLAGRRTGQNILQTDCGISYTRRLQCRSYLLYAVQGE
jgi:hypothetical protein